MASRYVLLRQMVVLWLLPHGLLLSPSLPYLLLFLVMLLQQITYHKFTSVKQASKRGEHEFESITQIEGANVFAVAAPVCGGCS